MSFLARPLSYDPQSLWRTSQTPASENTSSCQHFHASRMQALEKIQNSLKHFRRKVGGSNLSEDSTERKIFNLLNDMIKLAASDVKISGQFEKISEGADAIRHQNQKYHAWSTSGGLSPSIEEGSGGITPHFTDNLRISATLPRTADCTTMISPRFKDYHMKLGFGSKSSVFSACPPLSSSSSSSLVSTDKTPTHSLDHTSENPESKAITRGIKNGPIRSGAVEVVINPPKNNYISTKEDEVFMKKADKNAGQRPEHAIKIHQNGAVNKNGQMNKSYDPKIYVSDYDNKSANDIELQDHVNTRGDVGGDGCGGPRDDKSTQFRRDKKPLRTTTAQQNYNPGKEKAKLIHLSDKITGSNSEEQHDGRKYMAINKMTEEGIGKKNPAFLHRTCIPADQKQQQQHNQDGTSVRVKVKSRSEAPQVPVKKLNLSMIKKTNVTAKE